MADGKTLLCTIGVTCGIIFVKQATHFWKNGAKQGTLTAICILNSLGTLCLLAANLTGRVKLCAGSAHAQQYFIAVGSLISSYFLTTLRPAYISLKGGIRSVLITGCDSGFGNALAKHLSKFELKVYACCLNENSAGANELKTFSEAIQVIQLNITKNDDVTEATQLIKKGMEQNEEFWALVNNAGVVNMGEIELVPLDLIQQHLDVNVTGTIRMCKAFLSLLRKSRGRVVNVSSVMGKAGLHSLAGYAASKHAIEGFSDVLAQEMHKWGISVAVIEPGPYKTGLADPKDFEDYVALLWDKASDEVKDIYGKDYFDAYLKLEDFATDSDIAPVLHGIEDALLSRGPKRRYTMGYGCYLVPILSWIYPNLLYRSTFLMQRFTFYTNASPRALQK